MAKPPSPNPPGIPQHIIQRADNRQICFADVQDYYCFLTWLRENAYKFGVSIHAYVLMTNHVHILATPGQESGISRTMQSLGRQYARYFNNRYQQDGTLWEGRYKSCTVQADEYLLAVYRYIELNPLRAGLVKDPADYSWSSYQANGLGKTGLGLTAHAAYLSLGGTDALRQKAYRALANLKQNDVQLRVIRDAVNGGSALGPGEFDSAFELLSKHRQRTA